MKIGDLIFCRTDLPLNEFSAGRNGDYKWCDLWTEPSVCNRPVTGSHGFGSSHRLERCCLWLAVLPVRGSFNGCLYTIPVLGRDLRSLCPAELPRCNPRTPLVSRASYDVDVPVHSLLCCCFLGYVFAEWNSYDLVIILDSPWCRHPVWPDDGSVFAELDLSLYDPCIGECRQLLAFDPAVLRTPKFFRLILTFSYCLYDSLREQELGTGGSPITDRAACFHEQSKRAKWNVFALDSQDTMELWAFRPHVNWVKVICVCALHVFFHQYVLDLREGRLENIFRTVSTSIREQDPEIGGSHVMDMTDSFHGQIRLEKLDTFAAGSQDVRELWAVRPHAIFVTMMYTLESRRTFRGDLALRGLHKFLHLNVADIHEGISEKVSGIVSKSAFLLDVTVMSSSGVIVSPSDVPLTTWVSCIDTGIVATPFVVPPSPDIEQPCRQLQDSPMCRTPESRQAWLLWNLSAIGCNRIFFLRITECSAHTPPQKLPESSSSSSSIDRFRPLCRESSRPTGDALLPPPAVDCLCPGLDTPDSVGRREPFPNTLLLCLHVRRSGLCCQPDPPVPPTGSVVRILTTLPEGSPNSAVVIASSDHYVRMTLL